MGGGCQGCAVSAMTLRDGIERAIKEHIPEITEVVDATDHDAGENPFYTRGRLDSASAAAGEQGDAERAWPTTPTTWMRRSRSWWTRHASTAVTAG